MRHKSKKDVIVKWRDGSKNCVKIKDLKCLRKGEKVDCIGSKVKMMYDKKWYYGVVIMTEQDIKTDAKNHDDVLTEGSSEDELLIDIIKEKQLMTAVNDSQIGVKNNDVNNEVSMTEQDNQTVETNNDDVCRHVANDEEIDPYCDIDLEDPKDPDFIIESKRNKRTSLSSNDTICIQDVPNESELPNICKFTMKNKDCHREQHCEVIGCCSEVFSSCHRCFILLCWEHFKNNLCCEEHANFLEDKIPDNNCTQISKQIQSCSTSDILQDQNTGYGDGLIHIQLEEFDIDSSRTEALIQNCEVAGCNKDVNSSCFRCRILVCLDHFSEGNCDNHRQELSPSIMQLANDNEDVNSRNIQLFPEDFEVEGAPREIDRVKTKKQDKRKMNKLMKNTGKQHTTQVLKRVVPERTIGPSCRVFDCKRNCFRFTEENRKNIFESFWGQANLHSQREFIVRHVKKEAIKRRTAGPDSKRQATLKYFFLLEGQCMQVCQTFFLNTLGISIRTVRTSLEKVTESGTIEKEKRGGRKQCFIENDAKIRKLIEEHIDRFPKVESHYCRENSSKEYLHCDLTLPKMYHMFKEEIKDSSIKPSFSSYRRVFKSKNLSFHRPKKDQCSLCMTYLKGSEEEKLRISEKYWKHKSEKALFRSERKACKLASQQNPTKIQCATFDLQQVISLPISKENAVFYKRRLSAYNFTVYDMQSRDCSCYTWHEGASKRGSSEISTFLYDFLQKSDAKAITTVYLFADGCSGQNKNSIVASTLLYVISNAINIQEITLRFSVPCHGQSEGDSAHSTISYALKTSGDVFVPSQLPPILRLARKNKPYQVNVFTYSDFLDFKKLSSNLRLLSIRKDDEGRCLNWTEMTEFSVKKAEPEKIFFKTGQSETLRSLSLGRHVSGFLREEIGLLNPTPPKISVEKYNDLMSLTRGDTPVIRLPEHVAFYNSLSHT